MDAGDLTPNRWDDDDEVFAGIGPEALERMARVARTLVGRTVTLRAERRPELRIDGVAADEVVDRLCGQRGFASVA